MRRTVHFCDGPPEDWMPTREAAEFDPRGYLKVPGETAKLTKAIKQCPSIFELGDRIKTIKTIKTLKEKP